MMYFNDDEANVLRDMVNRCDKYGQDIPKVYSELIGVLRFKIDSETKFDVKDIEDGVDE